MDRITDIIADTPIYEDTDRPGGPYITLRATVKLQIAIQVERTVADLAKDDIRERLRRAVFGDLEERISKFRHVVFRCLNPAMARSEFLEVDRGFTDLLQAMQLPLRDRSATHANR